MTLTTTSASTSPATHTSDSSPVEKKPTKRLFSFLSKTDGEKRTEGHPQSTGNPIKNASVASPPKKTRTESVFSVKECWDAIEEAKHILQGRTSPSLHPDAESARTKLETYIHAYINDSSIANPTCISNHEIIEGDNENIIVLIAEAFEKLTRLTSSDTQHQPHLNDLQKSIREKTEKLLKNINLDSTDATHSKFNAAATQLLNKKNITSLVIKLKEERQELLKKHQNQEAKGLVTHMANIANLIDQIRNSCGTADITAVINETSAVQPGMENKDTVNHAPVTRHVLTTLNAWANQPKDWRCVTFANVIKNTVSDINSSTSDSSSRIDLIKIELNRYAEITDLVNATFPGKGKYVGEKAIELDNHLHDYAIIDEYCKNIDKIKDTVSLEKEYESSETLDSQKAYIKGELEKRSINLPYDDSIAMYQDKLTAIALAMKDFVLTDNKVVILKELDCALNDLEKVKAVYVQDKTSPEYKNLLSALHLTKDNYAKTIKNTDIPENLSALSTINSFLSPGTNEIKLTELFVPISSTSASENNSEESAEISSNSSTPNKNPIEHENKESDITDEIKNDSPVTVPNSESPVKSEIFPKTPVEVNNYLVNFLQNNFRYDFSSEDSLISKLIDEVPSPIEFLHLWLKNINQHSQAISAKIPDFSGKQIGSTLLNQAALTLIENITKINGSSTSPDTFGNIDKLQRINNKFQSIKDVLQKIKASIPLANSEKHIDIETMLSFIKQLDAQTQKWSDIKPAEKSNPFSFIRKVFSPKTSPEKIEQITLDDLEPVEKIILQKRFSLKLIETKNGEKTLQSSEVPAA